MEEPVLSQAIFVIVRGILRGTTALFMLVSGNLFQNKIYILIYWGQEPYRFCTN